MADRAIEGLRRAIAQKEKELETLKKSLEVLERMGGRISSTSDPGITIPKGGKRRRFSVQFKKDILSRIDGGEKMQDILERYGLYASHISSWRKQLREGDKPPPFGKKRGKAM